MNISNSTIIGRYWPVEANSQVLRAVVLAILGSFVVALAAQVNVPMLPVPMTLQTLAVLGVGAAFGSRLGAATLALYAFEGAIGFPVFAELKAGPAIIAGPTGGYIIGFILAAFVVGWFTERGWDRNVFKMFAAMLVGAAVLYVPGLLWLSGFVGGMQKAVEFGLTPFIIGDLVKAALAAVAFPAAWYAIGGEDFHKH